MEKTVEEGTRRFKKGKEVPKMEKADQKQRLFNNHIVSNFPPSRCGSRKGNNVIPQHGAGAMQQDIRHQMRRRLRVILSCPPHFSSFFPLSFRLHFFFKISFIVRSPPSRFGLSGVKGGIVYLCATTGCQFGTPCSPIITSRSLQILEPVSSE